MAKKYKKPTHGSLEWLTLRHKTDDGRTRFGASEAPILMGVSKYRTIADLAVEKWGTPEVSEPTPAMMRGNILEPALIDYANQVLGIQVDTPSEMFAEGRMIATLDGITVDGSTIVECKTTNAYSSDDECPNDYYWQVIAQMACCPQAEKAIVIVLDRKMRFGQWVIHRDEEAIADLLMQAEVIGDFLDRGELPPGTGVLEKHARQLWPDPAGTVEFDSGGVVTLEMFLAAREAFEVAEVEMQRHKDALAALLGSAETGTVDGQKVVSFKRRDSVRFDTKAFERDHPDLAEKYKKVSSTRVFRVS